MATQKKPSKGTSVRLSPQHLVILDKIAKKIVATRGETIRRAIVEMAERMGL